MIIYFFLSLFCLYYIFLYLQEYHYHFYGFIEIIKKGLKDKLSYILLISFLGLIHYDFSTSKIINLIIIICYCFFIILKIEEKQILKLKFTKRIIRNLFINLFFYFLGYLFFYRFVCLLPLLSLLISFISFLILVPVEEIIKKYYYHKARKKISKINPLVIAITGSAGKTSIKHFLYHILKEKYHCFMTKGSVNTANGIAKAINLEMNDLCEIAIIECGVSHVNDISEILKIINCNKANMITIISTIFPQHLETIKSFDLLVKEKAKLAQGKLHIGLKGIINELYNSDAKITKIIGIDPFLIDYKIGKSFKFSLDNKEYNYQCNVLGRNNITNILFSITIARFLGLKMKYIESRVRTLENVNNRLKIRKLESFNKIIIDDSFNSNFNGFWDALEVLSSYNDKSCVITPGIVSGGKYIKEYNQKIALKIMEVADKCFLVESVVSGYIKEIFDEKLYDYYYVASFQEAYKMAIEDYQVNSILIENDIPDIYKK